MDTSYLLYILAFYYFYYVVHYIKAARFYSKNDLDSILKSKGSFPILESENLDNKSMARRLGLTALLGTTTALSCIFLPFLGIALALYISVYEVKVSWGFYRENRSLLSTEGMLRFTVHSVLVGMLSTIALTRLPI